MSFDGRVITFAERFLSDRTFQLIILPALADLQFEARAGSVSCTAGRLAVLRAIAGGLSHDFAGDSRSFITLTLVPGCYYVFMLLLCFDFLSISLSGAFFVAAMLIVIISVVPVLACFWPDRPTARSVD